MRRGSIVQLVLIGVAAGAIATATAVFVPWMPVQASKEAHRIDFVYWFATVISLFVFAIVAAVLIYSLINFRVKPDDWSDGPPIHGHTTLEIVWTVVPAILVTSITIVSAIVLSQNGRAGTNPLRIAVMGEQFAWTFTYPNGQSYPSLHLPRRPQRRPQHHVARRPPLLLGAPVRPEAGRRSGGDQQAGDHPEPARYLPGGLHRALRSRPCADAQRGGRDERHRV